VEDFTKNGLQYDLILAVNGYHPIADYLRALKPEGTYVVAGGSMVQLFQAATKGKRISSNGRQKVHIVSQEHNEKDLVFLKELLASGKIMPVIDACYPLSKTAEAFRYFEKGHARGKVVITISVQE
jgi:NADPH:quinone reductase-like Zn-dependent oxidoreductase